MIDQDEGAIADAMSKGKAVTGGFDGPCWAPMLNPKFSPDVKPEALRAKLDKRGANSTDVLRIAGTLVIARAWGRPLYFLDVKSKKTGELVRVLLPEHKGLYHGLHHAEGAVGIELEGRGKPTKPGRQAPWRFRVVVLDGGKVLDAPRSPAPEALSMDERNERRDLAAARSAADAAPDADAGAYDDPEQLF